MTERLYKLALTAESDTGAFGPRALPAVTVQEGDTILIDFAIEIGRPPRTGPRISLNQFVVQRGEIRILACPFCGAICAGAKSARTSCKGALRPQGLHDGGKPHYCEAHKPQEGDTCAARHIDGAAILVLEKTPPTV